MRVTLRIFQGAFSTKAKNLFHVNEYNRICCSLLLRRRFSTKDEFVLHGPESPVAIPDGTAGEYIHKILLEAPKGSKAMIDGHSGHYQLYSDLLQKSVNLASALRFYGYTNQNTTLSICSENNLEYFIPILASLFNASVMQPLSSMYTSYELKRALELVKPKVVFCSETIAPKISQIKAEGSSGIEKIVLINSTEQMVKGSIEPCVEHMKEFTEKALKGQDEDVEAFRPIGGNSRELMAFICSSSGTTGMPKGVIQSQLNILTRLTHGRDPKYYRQEQTDKILGLLPFFHTYGLTYILGTIYNLQTIVYLKKFDEDLFLKTIQDFQITVLTLVPPLAIFLAKSEKVLRYDMSSVQDIYCGAASLDQGIAREVLKRLKNSSFRQALGLTECTATVTLINRGDDKLDSCGQVVSFMSAAVRDPESGRFLGPGNIGEFCWKGPLVTMGYDKNEKATEEAFTSDGWYRSGDLGYYDNNGYFYIVDRLKEIIKYNAYQVSPAELEAVIINHPDVKDAGVVGKPDEQAGELPLAFVVKKGDSNITEEQIKNYVKEMVSPHKQLRGGVIFTDAIPRNPSGKILRKVLKAQINNQNYL
ncbi:luciferin 4-monooxygenase-like [Anthonomus grandis grandis]|uniref:luciferin 4-monooxygenase-like n=1 Tax=Anthonomus grandis grandis TaxID=2921223 RepID=UPI002166AB53|nr:luciferin 4-monooxygenase-like [Anthonomus grandis grandis]